MEQCFDEWGLILFVSCSHAKAWVWWNTFSWWWCNTDLTGGCIIPRKLAMRQQKAGEKKNASYQLQMVLKNWPIECFVFLFLSGLTDTNNAFWWETLYVNRTLFFFFVLEENSARVPLKVSKIHKFSLTETGITTVYATLFMVISGEIWLTYCSTL